MRTIEHGNLIDEASAKLMAEKGMFLVANLVTYYEMKKRAAEYGMNSDMLAKNDLVIDGGLRSLEICKRARRPRRLRHRPARPVAGGAVATSSSSARAGAVADRDHPLRHPIGAQIMRMEGKIGCLKPGAFADLLVVDGNPLKNLKLLQDQGQHLSVIMKGGRFHKNRLQ